MIEITLIDTVMQRNIICINKIFIKDLFPYSFIFNEYNIYLISKDSRCKVFENTEIFGDTSNGKLKLFVCKKVGNPKSKKIKGVSYYENIPKYVERGDMGWVKWTGKKMK